MLSDGVYAVNEPALFKPAGRPFSRASRLTIRAEVLPDDPGWSPQSMPVLIHTMALSPNWMGRPDPVEIELDQAKRSYLHVVAGTPGSEIPAGLFTKRA